MLALVWLCDVVVVVVWVCMMLQHQQSTELAL